MVTREEGSPRTSRTAMGWLEISERVSGTANRLRSLLIPASDSGEHSATLPTSGPGLRPRIPARTAARSQCLCLT